MKLPHLTLSDQAAILAGLRLLQQALDVGAVPSDIRDILTDAGTLEPLDCPEIDSLCATINASRTLAKRESFEEASAAMRERHGLSA